MNALERYLQILIEAFEYDIEVYSQGWLYWWILVPAILYTIFFVLKWALLTAPIWIPIRIIIKGLPKFGIRRRKRSDDDI